VVEVQVQQSKQRVARCGDGDAGRAGVLVALADSWVGHNQ
jgi:hypothetical protein